MRILGRRAFPLALTILGGVLAPTVAFTQAGFYVTPSASVTEVYDDNLFSTSSQREKDFISRFSPGILAGYQSTPLTLLGRYTFDAEVYADHPELNDAQVRQEASLDFRYLPIPVLTLGVKAAYLATQTPQEFNVQTGVAAGRAGAKRYTVNPSISYRYDPLTAGTMDYAFTRDELAGGISTETHNVNLGLDRRITGQDTGKFGYNLRRFAFGDDTTMSHAFTLGWTREFTPLTSITLRGGPRVSDGTVDPEVSASIRHRLRRGELSFTYARSQTTAVGQAGTVNTEILAASATYQLLRFLSIGAAPSFIRSTRASAEVKVYLVNLDVTYQITKWLSLVGSYQFSLQQGSLEGRDEKIPHNVVLLRLVATYPYRVY